MRHREQFTREAAVLRNPFIPPRLKFPHNSERLHYRRSPHANHAGEDNRNGTRMAFLPDYLTAPRALALLQKLPTQAPMSHARSIRLILILCLPIAIAIADQAQAQATTPASSVRWYRGNTHSHTLNSDGNASPADVARWYKEHGFNFVVISDHEQVTDVVPLNQQLAEPGKFLVLQGEEVTQKVADSLVPDKRLQAHVGAIGISTAILPLGERGLANGTSMAAVYSRNVAAINAAGGLAQINHPNFRWSVKLDDIAQLPNGTLYEVWNAHPWVNNLGGSDGEGHVSLSTEALWDQVLTRGKLFFGVASDDAHTYLPAELEDPLSTRPGGGWVMVRADTLSQQSIMAAMKSGNFYASNGVFLDDYHATTSRIDIVIAPPNRPDDVRRFHTRFIGRGGKVLADVPGRKASYTIRGDEGYVRATITDSNGRQAWTQPIMLAQPARR
jgi:hypothetical protein